jgi:hypothetical protein
MALHYAPDLNDMSETPCLDRVDKLMEAGEDVTDNKEELLAYAAACLDCKEALLTAEGTPSAEGKEQT